MGIAMRVTKGNEGADSYGGKREREKERRESDESLLETHFLPSRGINTRRDSAL
jgi:hypothetical protein